MQVRKLSRYVSDQVYTIASQLQRGCDRRPHTGRKTNSSRAKLKNLMGTKFLEKNIFHCTQSNGSDGSKKLQF